LYVIVAFVWLTAIDANCPDDLHRHTVVDVPSTGWRFASAKRLADIRLW
jgi:hypothetical protein